MTETCLQAEVLEAKAEIQRLRESISSMSVGAPIVHKDLSLVTLVPKWSGSDSSITLEEFLSSIESAAKIGHWADPDKREIGVLKPTDSAKLFYQVCTELHAEGTTWHLGADMRMSTRTNIISRNCGEKANLQKNLQIVVEV